MSVKQTRGEAGGGVAAHLQCTLCSHLSRSHAHQLSHIAASHPTSLDDVAFGRLGNIVIYQSSAQLYHCFECFFTSKDFSKIYKHIISKHCMDGEGGGEDVSEKGEKTGDDMSELKGEKTGEREGGGGGDHVSEEKGVEKTGEREGGEGGDHVSEEKTGEREGGEGGDHVSEEKTGEREGGGGREDVSEKGEEKMGGREDVSEKGEKTEEIKGGGGGDDMSEKGEEKMGGGEDVSEKGEKTGGREGGGGGDDMSEKGEEEMGGEEGGQVAIKEEEEGEELEEDGASQRATSAQTQCQQDGNGPFEAANYRCLICGLISKQKCIGVHHVMRKHDIPKTYAAQAIKRCTVTSKQTRSRGTEEEEETGLSRELLKEEVEAMAKVIRFISNRFVCLICGWKTKLKGFAISHVVSCHDVERPYTCKDCQSSFFLPSRLQQHISTAHRPGRYGCPFCSFRSHFLGGFRRHCSRCTAREGREDCEEGRAGVGVEEKRVVRKRRRTVRVIKEEEEQDDHDE